ncbi:MAG: hypothetical protein U5L72_00400 [Bacteroidales bacterium]|nr:hypothetical protein [Bacteroidales bacterium]
MKSTMLLVLITGLRITLFAQPCDECSYPRVALYDCLVSTVRPDDPGAITAWQTLYWPAAAARGDIRSNDPEKNCIVWMDGAMINANELQNGKFKFGSEFSNLPPPGAISSADYIITSKVESRGSNYVFFLILETAESREIVKTVEIEFNATVDGADNAGKQAARQLMPLFETIRKFEIDKRNSDLNVAIRNLWRKDTSDDIIVKPKKLLVKTGESVDVEITMIDCDGVPLANRRILFNDTTVQLKPNTPEMPFKGTRGGEITPRVATTDEAGKVTVQFKAGNKAGLGQIVAWFPHQKPWGRADAFMGSAIVQINPLPPKFWVLNGLITSTTTLKRDTVMTFDMGGLQQVNENSIRVQTKSRGKIIAVIENLAEEPAKSFHYFTEEAEPIAMFVTAEGVHDEFITQRETIDGKLSGAGTRRDNVRGIEVLKTDIQFTYSPDSKYISFGININAVGSYTENRYAGEWSEYVSDIDSYSIWCTGGGDAMSDKNCMITKSEKGYNITCTFKTNEQKSTANGTEYSTTEGSLSATLTPVQAAVK